MIPLLMAPHALAKLTVQRPLVESRVNPLGIDTPEPRFSWTLTSDQRNVNQTSYQVLVATAPDLLTQDAADLWNSGVVESSQSLHIAYAGKALASSQQVFWTVRTSSSTGEMSEWSEPATWTMGLLAPSDWQGTWIGASVDMIKQPLGDAQWICFPTDDVVNQPVTRWIFTKSFNVPKGFDVVSARMTLRADNNAQITLNGTNVATLEHGTVDVASHLVTDQTNELSVTVENYRGNGADAANPAGLIGIVALTSSDGRIFNVETNDQWQAAQTTSPDAKQSAQVIGEADFQWWKGTSGMFDQQLIPMLRTDVPTPKPIRRAVVHVIGLGQYRFFVNGAPVRESILDGDWASYEDTVFYDTFDITDQLRGGGTETAALGVILASGNYSNIGDRRIHVGIRHRPLAFRMQGTIEYEDGTTQSITSNTDDWKWKPSPYTHNAIVGGCDYDARLLPDGWDKPGFDDAGWSDTIAVDWPFGVMTASMTPPLRVFKGFAPQTIDQPEPGAYVYDFVQNSAATLRLKVRGTAGQTLRLTYGEQRHGATPHQNDGTGRVNQVGIGSPNYIEYTLKGDAPEEWLCDLFYSGFQYVELTGGVPAGKPNPDKLPVVTELTSLALMADVDPVGKFTVSDPLLTKIDHMIDWAVRSNLSYVLTDCPQREKFGWLEVPHLMWPSLVAKYDLSSFGPKISRDIRDTQDDAGRIVTVAPSFIVDGYHFGGATGIGYTVEWGAAGALIPWYVYASYGDERCLENNYPMMKGFVDYLHSSADENLVPPDGGLGDWFDYGHGQALGPSKFTPSQLTAMAIFHDCARRVADAAAVLGHPDDEAAYRALAAKIATNFNTRFYDRGTAQYENRGSCQTANAIAIATGIAPEDQIPRLIDAIVTDLESRSYQQTSGDVGFHYLIRALADNGRGDVIYRILQRTDIGSYGFLANNGWSALPEAWNADSNSSMNHCMLGHIEEFFAQDIGGIKPVPGQVAFRHFAIDPSLNGSPDSAAYIFRSPYGIIASEWTRTAWTYSLKVTVPVNTTADVYFPTPTLAAITESNGVLTKGNGLLNHRLEGSQAVVTVGSGTYHFKVNLK